MCYVPGIHPAAATLQYPQAWVTGFLHSQERWKWTMEANVYFIAKSRFTPLLILNFRFIIEVRITISILELLSTR
jgi:hypothetical protein